VQDVADLAVRLQNEEYQGSISCSPDDASLDGDFSDEPANERPPAWVLDETFFSCEDLMAYDFTYYKVRDGTTEADLSSVEASDYWGGDAYLLEGTTLITTGYSD
jgi:hypothetical protein